MTPVKLGHKGTSHCLHTQIRDAERRVLNRQRAVTTCKLELIGSIRRKMVSPASLILAGSIGFITGELSKCPPREPRKTITDSGTAEPTRLRNVIDLMLMLHTLYSALPVSRLMKRFNQPSSPNC